MPKRVPVPEGKALFFRSPEALAAKTSPAEILGTAQESGPKSPTRQSAIFLEERHLDWLEDRCREARRNGGRAIRKAVIIRALLDVAMSAPIDLTCLRREDDVVLRIRRALRSV